MITRNHIESILKINGISPTSSDEEIRSVLLSASFDKDEVDAAVMILRQNVVTNKTRLDGLHKVFRTDEPLSSGEVSSLLGVDINSTYAYGSTPKAKTRNLNTLNYLIITLLSFVIAFIGVMIFMYIFEVGVFHPSAQLHNAI